MSDAVNRFIVMTHTADDDKDEGNGVSIRIFNTVTGVIYLALDNYGRGLTFRNGDDNGWDRPANTAMSLDDAKNTALWVEMNGDDGDWKAAFSVAGFTAKETTQITLLQKTVASRFYSGKNTSRQFPCTYGQSSRRLARDSKIGVSHAAEV